jgi:hypothetical protein
MISPGSDNATGRHIHCSWFALCTKGNVMKLEHVRNFTEIRDVHPGKLSITESIKTLRADEGTRSFFAARSFVAMKGEQS